MIYLITGKAGAGKTHYATELQKELRLDGQDVIWLDGDIFRKQTGNNDYSLAGRRKNLMEAAVLVMEYERTGKTVILSFIAPTIAWRQEMRSYWQESQLIYIPGGTLWKGTSYQTPIKDERDVQRKE